MLSSQISFEVSDSDKLSSYTTENQAKTFALKRFSTFKDPTKKPFMNSDANYAHLEKKQLCNLITPNILRADEDAAKVIAQKIMIEGQAEDLLHSYYDEFRSKSKEQLSKRHDQIKDLEQKAGISREGCYSAKQLKRVSQRILELSKPKEATMKNLNDHSDMRGLICVDYANVVADMRNTNFTAKKSIMTPYSQFPEPHIAHIPRNTSQFNSTSNNSRSATPCLNTTSNRKKAIIREGNVMNQENIDFLKSTHLTNEFENTLSKVQKNNIFPSIKLDSAAI